jgi:hypothetical protein
VSEWESECVCVRERDAYTHVRSLSHTLSDKERDTHTHRDKERDARTAGGVLRTNAFDDDEGFANLYEITSRVNHACQPRSRV